MPETAMLPAVDEAVALGLTRDEYALIVDKLGRAPNQVELAMFSLLWSEHCAYKHSKLLLKTLPTEGRHVVMGPGENAGAVSVGGGLAVAFKVESHNHPSAVEPFQGAATGVGGILRDIFALGARPIAVLDSLRFGEPDASERSRYLLDHAVAGIGHYGNSIGVPTIGGEVYFEAPYEQSCLVNAMALGLAETRRMIRSAAAGVGNVVVLFGASTGRDGIGGASVLASAELDEADGDKRPSVQVGDPFAEKKLMECSLELLERDLLVALQDLGAAGLTSASAEMASKGGVGIDLDVARMPLREADMEPFEIMVSESQERMLCVCEPARLDDVLAVCARWEVHGTAIGEVTDARAMRIFRGDELVGDIPVAALVDDCPVYELAPQRPGAALYDPPAATLAPGGSVHGALLALLASPNLASRRPLFEQYDSIVQSRTVRRPEEADAAVLALPDGGALGVAIDGNGRRVAADPYQGTVAAMLECAANLACVGAEPLGVTNNLNFGNPEKPHIAWQLTEAVRGLGDACRALGVPVTGGNVSLYNESPAPGGPIYPTPVIGMERRALAGRERAGQAVGRAAARRPARGRARPRPRRAGGRARRGARRHPELLPRRRRRRLPRRGRRVLPGRGHRRDARPRAQRRSVVPSLRRAPGRVRPLGAARRARRARAGRAPRRVRDRGRRCARAHDRRRHLALGPGRAARGPRRAGAPVPLAATAPGRRGPRAAWSGAPPARRP
jgi:phosphoribosylformylglycinamidine synthase II